MDIYVYSDESGVFDHIHNIYYVFGGLILLGKNEKDSCERKYKKAEASISHNYAPGTELKASVISPAERSKLFRSVNHYNKFGAVITQADVNKEIFNNKKSKQRFLDFAYKRGVKNALQQMMNLGLFLPSDVDNMYFYIDEHTTATDGRYELREGLLQEFKEGTFNYNFQKFFEPIFPDIHTLNLQYCNSAKKTLVRTADIIANRIYHEVLKGNDPKIRENLYIQYLP